MLKTKLAFGVVLVGAAACATEFGDEQQPPRPRNDRAAASQLIWNAAPPAIDRPIGAIDRFPIMSDAVRPPRPGGGTTGTGVDANATKRTLVLFDRGGPYGALGELYAIGGANLASHFGPWTAKAAVSYACGELANYDALLYIGSTYDEPLPACLLADVNAGARPVIWSSYNVWQLATPLGGRDAFASRYGWLWPPADGFDLSTFAGVTYKGRTLARYAASGAGLFKIENVNAAKATVLASARRADGSSRPWAIRTGNFTYVSEIPFTYMTEEDRYLIFADLLFDALAPNTVERHRVVLRLEDISPDVDPSQLDAISQYLREQGIPFGFGVISEYRDPHGYYTNGIPVNVKLSAAPQFVAALKTMASSGGLMVMHGYTHQFEELLNPYNAVTGDDTEFYRMVENADHSITYVGPLPGDSVRSARDRIDAAHQNFHDAGLESPWIFEFPHYAGSPAAYRAVNNLFTTRWERALYFEGTFSGSVSYERIFGQLFPYAVRDVYGTRVLPENLGNIEPEPFYIFPTRFPEDIINAAEKNLVVRDGVAGFYFHPFFDIQYLKDTVAGLQALGYQFVSPDDL